MNTIHELDGIKKGIHWKLLFIFFLLFLILHTLHQEIYDRVQQTLLVDLFINLVMFISAWVIIYRYYRVKLKNLVYVDPITGGNTLESFYKLAEEMTLSNQKQYALVYSNIKNFKLLNDYLGRDHCDHLLRIVYENTNLMLTNKEIVGRVSADNFCFLLEHQSLEKLLSRFEHWIVFVQQKTNNLQERFKWMNLEVEFGIYIIEDHTLPFPLIIDRAKLALRETKMIPNTKLRYALYDDQLRCQLLREKQIEGMMEDALNNGEFQIYLQPKYSLADERMSGAEALTRWVSKSEGLIYPNEFIPLFENNGFIVKLDLWMFEEVCRLLRRWIDEGKEPVKISVNCSRVHFMREGFINEYIDIAHRYKVPEHLIELELTESLALEDTQQFIQRIRDIRKAGFGCSVDDFGNGYSSLSIIEQFPVDTLKLDKAFFSYSSENKERTEIVINSVIAMAKSLSMKVVAEGVENLEQMQMLKRLGCDYIQGYVIAKPLPIKDFERYL